MATAPRPGIGQRIDAASEEAKLLDSGMRVTCEAENRTVEALFGDLAADDELTVKRETGFGPAELLNDSQIAHIGVVAWYWLGLRATNDVRPLRQLIARYGTRRSFMDGGFTADGVGPYFADEPEGDDADPLTVAGPSETPGPNGPASTASSPGTSAAGPS